jgi:hypothetical protein
MPSQNVKIAIGVSTAVVVVAIIIIIVLFAFPIKQPEQAADEPVLPSTITYEFSFKSFIHVRVDIDPEIKDSLDGMEDGESIIAMYRTSTESMYNYTVVTRSSSGYKVYYLNSALFVVYEPFSISSVEDLSGIDTMTKSSDSTYVYDVTIAVESN